jgi:uncharacterized repeat protein (TIGR01451 family)
MAQTIQYGYDPTGRLTHVGYPDGSAIDYVYDNLGNRLTRTTTLPGGPSNQSPAAVTNPSIANGVTNASTTPILSWNAAVNPNADGAIVYFVYFGTSPFPPLAYSGFATNWSPGQLQGLTTYYWQVVARNNYNEETASPIWSFTTSNEPPVANFAVNITNGWAPLAVTFSDQSTSPDGTIVAWQWSFNNNGIVNSTSRNPTFTFTNGGEYTVSLTVQDSFGATATITKTNLIGVFGTNIISLTPVSLAVDSATSFRNLLVQYSISNQGTVNVTGSWSYADAFYVSTNSVFNASATQIAIFYEKQALPPGFVYSRTNPVTIPAGIGTNYYLFLKTDANNQLGEINPATTVTNIPLEGNLPDLAAGNISLVGTAGSGQSGQITYTATNQGALEIDGQWTDGIYISSNSFLDSSAVEIGTVSVDQDLPVGGSYTVTNAVTFPQWPLGNYYLLLSVDSGYTIAESNQSNNVYVAPITLSAPDLVPVAMTIISSGPSGVQLVCVVTNRGAAGAKGAWYDGIYGSTNRVFTTNATSLGYTYLNHNVAGGGSYSWTNTVVVPTSATNAYYLFVVVDDPKYGDVILEETKTNNIGELAAGTVALDLAPVAMTITSSGSSGVQLVCVVTNQGAAAAQGLWYDGIYGSTNPAFTTNAVSLGYTYLNHSVAGGGNYSWTNTITIPSTATNAYYLFVVADDPNYGDFIYETTKSNNVAVLALGTVAPDLAPVSLQVPVVGVAGGTVSLVCVVTNQGAANSQGLWYDGIYGSTSPTFNASAKSLGYVYLNHSVATGASYVWTNTVTIPSTATNAYYFFVVVDDPNYGDFVYETTKSNNIGVLPLAPLAPDLAPVSLQVPVVSVVGGSVSVVAVVTNQGAGSAQGSWVDSVYGSTNSVYDANAVRLLAVRANPAVVPAGSSYAWTNSVTVPQVVGQSYYLFVVVDDPNYGDFVYETNKINNVSAGLPLLPEAADLAPVSLQVPAVGVAGGTISLVCVVTNEGAAGAQGTWDDGIYGSSNATFNGSAVHLGSASLSHNVAAAGSYSWTNSVTIPTTATNAYYFFVVVDDPYYSSPIYETTTSNNTGVLPLIPLAPDLAPVSLQVPVVSVVGGSVSVVAVVTNQGAGSAQGSWVDSIWGSTNSVYDANAVRLTAFRANPAVVSAGSSYTWTNQVTVPQVTGQNYYLFVLVDDPSYGDFVYETNKSNNTSAGLPLLPEAADLAPVAMTIASSGSSGVQLVCVVTNEGESAAQGTWYDGIYGSTNSEFDGTAVRLLEPGMAHNVAAGSSYTWTNTFTAPVTATNAYYLFAVVDDPYEGDLVLEVTKTNNIGRLTVATSAPDLVPLVMSVASSGPSGAQLVCVVTNQGVAPAQGTWYDGIYASTNPVFDANAVRLLEPGQNHNVQAGGSYSWTNTVPVPTTATNAYYLFVVVDDPYEGDFVLEETKANNIGELALATAAPDLVPVAMTVPSSGTSGVQLICVVTNQGVAPAQGTWYDGIYGSTNSLFDASAARLLEPSQNHNISAASSYSWTNTVPIPATATNAYYLFVVVDDPYEGDFVSEETKTNNIGELALATAAPDLAPVSLQVPVVSVAGGTVSVVCTVTNQGAASAQGTWYDGIYGSVNSVFDGNAVRLLEPSLSHNVAAGGNYAWTNSVTMPQISGQSYYLFVVVDDPYEGDFIYEAIKSNNISTGALINVVQNLPGIAIAEDAAPNPVYALSNLVFTTSAINRGPSTATGVSITDPIPAGFHFVSTAASQGALMVSDGLFTWNVGTMSNGAVVAASVVVRPNTEGVFTNTATVSWSTGNPSTNTTASAVTTVLQNPGGPLLQIARVGTNVSLYWSTNDVGFILQSTPNLAATNGWSAVTNVPVIIGNSFYVTNAIPDLTTFYRLGH